MVDTIMTALWGIIFLTLSAACMGSEGTASPTNILCFLFGLVLMVISHWLAATSQIKRNDCQHQGIQQAE